VASAKLFYSELLDLLELPESLPCPAGFRWHCMRFLCFAPLDAFGAFHCQLPFLFGHFLFRWIAQLPTFANAGTSNVLSLQVL